MIMSSTSRHRSIRETPIADADDWAPGTGVLSNAHSVRRHYANDMQMAPSRRPTRQKKEKKTQTERSDGDRQKTDGKEKHEGKQRAVN